LILGYPYPYLAGIVAGLLQFIPYIGPFLTAIPVIFLGFAEGPTMALYALLVMTGVQLLESNAITPMVFRHQVSLPPALTLIGTVTMGLVFGPLGLIIGSPLVLLFLVVYRMVYQHDVLGDRVHIPGGKESL
jgi:predicted PurR-regulated permease PerM